MNVQRKDASIQNTGPVDDFPGSFEVILSAPTKDRDGDTLRPEDWKQPLPEHITFDMDHGMSVATTVGSGVPRIDESTGNLVVSGTYSSLARAQEVRTLVNEGHIRTTSVAFMKEPSSTTKDGKPSSVRELLNGAFVAVPSNREALVLSSKSMEAKAGARNSSRDQALLQSAHDALVELGAQCGPMDDTGAVDGAVSGAAFDGEVGLKAKYTAEQRREMAKRGEAMPDGSFPIGDRQDLESAIRLNGHGNAAQSKVRDFIKRRAAALNLSSLIPDSWKSFDDPDLKASFTPLKRGTHVSWRYRATRGHGVIEGVHKMGSTHANTEYSIRESDHHVSASGSHEPSIVYHYGSDITVEDGKSIGTVYVDVVPRYSKDLLSAAQTAQGLDGVIDSMRDLVNGQSLDGLPEWAAQALSLIPAADASSDDLLDAMGVDDPDDDDDQKSLGVMLSLIKAETEARSA